MDYKLKDIAWESDKKDRVRCNLVYKNGDRAPGFIAKDSPDWPEVLKVISIEELDQEFADRRAREIQKHKVNKAERERAQERQRQEALFQAKLDLFEIDIIKSSKNRKIKSKIRKAKTVNEAFLYASILANREFEEE